MLILCQRGWTDPKDFWFTFFANSCFHFICFKRSQPWCIAFGQDTPLSKTMVSGNHPFTHWPAKVTQTPSLPVLQRESANCNFVGSSVLLLFCNENLNWRLAHPMRMPAPHMPKIWFRFGLARINRIIHSAWLARKCNLGSLSVYVAPTCNGILTP